MRNIKILKFPLLTFFRISKTLESNLKLKIKRSSSRAAVILILDGKGQAGKVVQNGSYS